MKSEDGGATILKAAGQALPALSKGFEKLISSVQKSGVVIGGLKGIFSGLLTVVKAHPILAAATAFLTLWNVISRGKQEIKELVQEASTEADNWRSSNTSLEANMAEIEQLKTSLSSGTLTEQEAYDAKSRLLEIQNALSESYGSSAENINLVTGSIESQISALKELARTEAEDLVNDSDNQKAYRHAKDEMEKTRKSSFSTGSLDQNEKDEKTIKEILDKYKDDGLTYGEFGTGLYVDFEGNVSQQKEILNSLINDIREGSAYANNPEVFENIIGYASEYLTDANAVLSENEDFYNNFNRALGMVDPKQFEGKHVSDWMSDY